MASLESRIIGVAPTLHIWRLQRLPVRGRAAAATIDEYAKREKICDVFSIVPIYFYDNGVGVRVCKDAHAAAPPWRLCRGRGLNASATWEGKRKSPVLTDAIIWHSSRIESEKQDRQLHGT